MSPERFATDDGHAVEVYRDDAGRWRWRILAKNHRIVAASEQGYRSKWYARRKAKRAGRAYGS